LDIRNKKEMNQLGQQINPKRLHSMTKIKHYFLRNTIFSIVIYILYNQSIAS